MMILILFCELSRTSGFIDIPTIPQYNISGMYGLGLMFSARIYSDDPDPLDDQKLDPMDFDVVFRYGLGGRGEISLSMFNVNSYVVCISYLLAKEEKNIPAFFAGIDDISYNTHLSTLGMKEEPGSVFIEEYNYATHTGGRPWELFSTYLGMQKTFAKHFNFVLGLGRGRFVGYGDRSHYFNTDLFVLDGNYKSPEHSWWAVGIFFGGSLKFPNLEICAEIDGRDGNAGIKYYHKYVTATLALAKAEHLRWWNKAPYTPRLTFGLEANNRAMVERPRTGSIECIVQDGTSKQLLLNSTVDIKEVNKRYKATTGTFAISLPAGNYTITVSMPNYVDYLAKVSVKPGVKSKFMFNLKKSGEALKREMALKEREKNIKTYFEQGKLYFSEGNLDQAEKAFRMVLSLDTANIVAMSYLVNMPARRTELITAYKTEARSREKAKDLTRALEYWQKILKLEPGNTEAKTAIANLQKQISAVKKPPPETKAPVAKKATKEEIEALYNKGVSYFAADKYEEALKAFKQVLALDPAHKGAKDYKKRTEARIRALKGG